MHVLVRLFQCELKAASCGAQEDWFREITFFESEFLFAGLFLCFSIHPVSSE